MILGKFGEIGELFFEIELIAADDEKIPIETLLDTGFTTGWLALDLQDALCLGWSVIERRRSMQTARGEQFFDLYEGRVLVDSKRVYYSSPCWCRHSRSVAWFAVVGNSPVSRR